MPLRTREMSKKQRIYRSYLSRDLPGNELHQWDHALICVVVATDDPHHADGIHHRREGVESHTERPLADVFEVALERGEKPVTASSFKKLWRGPG